MRLTYLVKSEPDQSAISLADEDVSCDVERFGAPEQDLWLLSYSTQKNALGEAMTLSAISSGFDSLDVEYLLLEDGASAYYERRLFEGIANFERKLRAVLSMRVALLDGDLGSKLVSDLEDIDFGKLFERFFIDDAFVDAYRDILKKGGSKYEKADLLAEIEALPESGEWDRLFNDDEAPTVKSSHGFVRKIRNDVMHAHRMPTDVYRKAKATLAACNEELDALLDDLPGELEQPSGFTAALANVLGESQAGPTWDDLSHFTWDDLSHATWDDLARHSYWVEYNNRLARPADAPMRGSAEGSVASKPEIARVLEHLAVGDGADERVADGPLYGGAQAL